MVKINSANKLYQKAILDDLIAKIEIMDLEEEIIEKIKTKLNEKRKRKMPSIALEKQCNSTCKNGEKCKTAMCYKSRCWAHLDKEERENYRKIKETR